MANKIAAIIIIEEFNLKKNSRIIPDISGNSNLRKVAFFQMYILNVFAILKNDLKAVKELFQSE